MHFDAIHSPKFAHLLNFTSVHKMSIQHVMTFSRMQILSGVGPAESSYQVH